jgi:anti-sigma regulatory factor (Ser/Thr protein kinase)
MVATEWVIDVEPELRCIAPTRAAVRDQLSACGVAQTADAELMVSELVGNAIVHAGTEISVTVRCTRGRTIIEVHDGSSVLPEVRGYEPMRPGGHGLRIVEALASRWGVEPSPDDGKTVWFEVQPSASRLG